MKELIILTIMLMPLIAIATIETTETYNDYTITWKTIKDFSTNKEYIVTIQNFRNVNREFPLAIIIKGLNLDADIELYERKEIPTTITNHTITCNPVILHNGSNDVCIESGTPIIVDIVGWKKTAGQLLKISDLQKEYGMINIPALNSKPKLDYYGNIITQNGTKTFKVIIKNINPVLYNEKLAILDTFTGHEFHPFINSTRLEIDFPTDGTNPDLVQDSLTLNRSTSLLNGLLSHYTFDDANTFGLNTTDSLHGDISTIHNGVTTGASGKLNEAYDFDGLNDYVNISGLTTGGIGRVVTNISVTDEFTFTAWVKPKSISGDNERILSGNGGLQNDGMFLIKKTQAGGLSQAFVVYDAGSLLGGNGGTPWSTTVYRFVVFYYNGRELVMIVNETVDINESGAIGNIDLVSGLNIGGFHSAEWADVFMDELSFWDRELFANEQSELFNNGFAKEYPWSKTSLWNSTTLHSGDNHDLITPEFTCTGTCIVNLTIENEFFGNVTSLTQITLSTTPVDGNTSINMSIFIAPDSSLFNLSFSFGEQVLAPVISEVEFHALNFSQIVIGNESFFDLDNLQIIEYALINFTIANFEEPLKIFFTANGTNACTLGNKQNDICFKYPDFVEWNNNSNLQYFDSTTSTVGDFISCIVNGSTSKTVSCTIDEHYNPNIFKWYNANLNFSDVKYQNGVSQRISSSGNRILKLTLNGSIPLNATGRYKLDFRVQPINNPTETLDGYLCNSSYTTGNPSTTDSCLLVVQHGESGIIDEKFRGIFTNDTLATLGDIQHVVLQSQQIGTVSYYALKTIKSTNATWVTNWNYSTNMGTTWINLGDGYETEVNINWFDLDSALVIRIGSNETNSTDNVLTWGVPTGNIAPLLVVIKPINNTDTTNTSIFIDWLTNSPEGLGLNVSIYFNGLLNQTDFVGSGNTFINDTALGTHDVVVESCDTTPLCFNISRTIIISAVVIPANVTNITLANSFTCLKRGVCTDGIRDCQLVLNNLNNETVDTDALDLQCQSFRSSNPFIYYLLYILAMFFIFIGFRFRMLVFVSLGMLFALLASWLIIHLIGMIAVFFILIFMFLMAFYIIIEGLR